MAARRLPYEYHSGRNLMWGGDTTKRWRDREGEEVGMQIALSPQDYSRLMTLASQLAARKRITSSEAVGLIESAVMDTESVPRRRSVTEFASGMLAVRNRRNDTMGASVFRDPAWDMMLDLLVAAHQGRRVCVSSLCYASGVPNSTALRHIEYLDQIGLVERTPDPEDHRRAYIAATPPAIEQMTKIVARMQDAALVTQPKVAEQRAPPHAMEIVAAV